jgi:periplasmic protein TonB
VKRFAGTAGLALLIVMVLFWAMHWMIRAPEAPLDTTRTLDGIEMVQVRTEEQPPPEELFEPDNAPPPPPAMPAMAAPPTISVPTLGLAPADAGNVSVPVALGSGGLSLGSSGAFAGFAGGGGSGAGGSGKGFRGKPLVPLSTARPQMPEWACKRGIRGWVEVVFTVMPNGRVQNVQLVDADPRGVFETAAIESISNWIYEQTGRAMEVKQRVPMNPEDCAYNWP